MKKILLSHSLFLISYFSFSQDINGTIKIGSAQREYILHLPNGYTGTTSLPLVMIFHGGGGNSRQMQRYMQMDAIADKESFITVYPNGVNKQWNDGREFKESITANDDIQFISQLYDTLVKKYSIDRARVFATGISNGGFFSIFLAYQMNDRFTAVAAVCASIPEKIFNEYTFKRPVSVMLMNGTADPLVPYEGGTIGNRLTGGRGECTSTEETVNKFIALNHTAKDAVIEELPNKAKLDGCKAIRYNYRNGTNNAEVDFIKVIDGGHTLPGGAPYLPKSIIGKVCRDFNGNEMIWQFFKSVKN